MENNNTAKKVGCGEFGDIYLGIKGDVAIRFLLRIKSGEVRGAFFRLDIGEIDLVWGQDGENGYGLAKILEKHPEAISGLSLSIETGIIVESFLDRKIIISGENGQKSVVDLCYRDRRKTWLVTSYIPIK
jgi:hypothetical protein